MPLVAPNLDDRTFDALVAEARRLIPRYLPEWTDHNAHDPGITLIELFAWLTELTLFRFNQVPERHYIKFLQLLGIELEPARPARVDLQFTLEASRTTPLALPRGVQVEVPGAALVFETTHAALLTPSVLDRVLVWDGRRHVDRTTHATAADQTLHPFGRTPSPGNALVLGFDAPGDTLPDARLELWAYVPDDAGPATCGPATPVTPPPALLAAEGYDGARWSPVILERDETRGFTRTGRIVIRGVAALPRIDLPRADLDDARHWVRLRMRTGAYDRAPRLDTVLTNVIGAVEGVTIPGERLGESDGLPDQTATVSRTPIEAGTLRIEVDGEPWSAVDDLLASGPGDRHFTVNRNTGRVTFGDGETGRIPPTGASIIARAYRTGGGRRGNVGADTVTELPAPPPGVRAVTNRRPARGGADEETVDNAKRRAAGALKARDRAVTAEDFEHLARQTPYAAIARAKALPLAHPRFPGERVPGAVTVLVVPDTDARPPRPVDSTLRAVCAHLDRHRLLTTEVHVAGPTWRTICVEIDLIAAPDHDLAVVLQAVEARLETYLDPLEGGEDGAGWPFGGTLYYARLYRQVLTVPGVDRLADDGLVVVLDGERQPPCRDVALYATDLPLLSGAIARGAYEGWT